MKDVLTIIQEKHNNSHIKFPSNIDVSNRGNEVKVQLPYNASISNMQSDANAFESWMLVIKNDCPDVVNIYLDIENAEKLQMFRDMKAEGGDKGHYGRFLYRCMKFRQMFSWFKIGDELLQKRVDEFEEFLKSGHFINNIGKGDAGCNTNKEIQIENAFASEEGVGIFNSIIGSLYGGKVEKLYRQLPVGVFLDKVERENEIFTRSHSAIDLWGLDKAGITLVELKTKNKMMGIITEILFYANLIKDFLDINTTFKLSNDFKERESLRGYDVLFSANEKQSIKEINAVMLAEKDGFHPLVEDALMTLRKSIGRTGMGINFYMANYEMSVIPNSIVDSKGKLYDKYELK